MKYFRIDVAASEYQQEELIAFLNEFNPTGYEQNDDTLTAYFAEGEFDKEGISQVLKRYIFQLQELAEKNWNEEWESNFQPVVVDDFVAVRADFHKPVEGVQHEIVITPKMSFGTGHHATTYMMMQQMRGLDFRHQTVFDFGTGTGILAVLAEKLGAATVSAIDVDNWSLANAIENLERNACNNIFVSLSSIIPQEQFAIILANINRNVILDYLPSLAEALLPNGQILFSGLLNADFSDVNDAAKKCSLLFQKKVEREGWLSVLFVKPT